VHSISESVEVFSTTGEGSRVGGRVFVGRGVDVFVGGGVFGVGGGGDTMLQAIDARIKLMNPIKNDDLKVCFIMILH
jgi:hypothetical protein